jgi:hypothetical protein
VNRVVLIGVVCLLASGCGGGGSPQPSPATSRSAFVLTGTLTMATCEALDAVSIVDTAGSVVASEPVAVPAGTNCRITFEITVPSADVYRVQLGDQGRLTLSLESGQRDFQWSGGISGVIHAEPAGG